MKIVVTGGGSGGHITPVLAVAHELKRQQPETHITYIGQKGDKLGDIPAQDPSIDQVLTVRAGKFRRYHGEGLRQLLDISTVAKNIRDAIWVLVGIWQSFWLLRKVRPDVIFTRGAFVSVPVCLAAAALRIPYITHDSDAIPSLANRIIGRFARLHAVALPKEVYAYPQDKTVTVGIPISSDYHQLKPAEIASYREQLGLGEYKRVLLLTGGGHGAERLNNALVACAPDLLARYKNLAIVQIAGRTHEDNLRRKYKETLSAADAQRVLIRGYVTNLYQYSGAADVIITRAGGTSIAEYAAQAKACVVVPNPQLTGGHQTKNAKVLADRKAVRMVTDEAVTHDPVTLMAPVVDLLDSVTAREQLGQKLARLTQADASERLAVLLLEVAKR